MKEFKKEPTWFDRMMQECVEKYKIDCEKAWILEGESRQRIRNKFKKANMKSGDKIRTSDLDAKVISRIFKNDYIPEYITIVNCDSGYFYGAVLCEAIIPPEHLKGYNSTKFQFFLNRDKIKPMKTPEQRIAELEKKIDEQLVEIVGLKNELKKETKEKTVLEIITSWPSQIYAIGINEHVVDKVKAIRDMIAVSYYLNEGWKPDFTDDSTEKFAIYYDFDLVMAKTMSFNELSDTFCYFKSESLAQRAIKILGEERIKLALS